eukprot:977890-Prymnesium_polylepis.1
MGRGCAMAVDALQRRPNARGVARVVRALQRTHRRRRGGVPNKCGGGRTRALYSCSASTWHAGEAVRGPRRRAQVLRAFVAATLGERAVGGRVGGARASVHSRAATCVATAT